MSGFPCLRAWVIYEIREPRSRVCARLPSLDSIDCCRQHIGRVHLPLLHMQMAFPWTSAQASVSWLPVYTSRIPRPRCLLPSDAKRCNCLVDATGMERSGQGDCRMPMRRLYRTRTACILDTTIICPPTVRVDRRHDASVVRQSSRQAWRSAYLGYCEMISSKCKCGRG
jgi:hypothetical protein